MTGLKWTKHPRRDETECATRRHWHAKGAPYRVTESNPKLHGLARLYYAMRLDLDAHCWDILKRHRTRHAAIATCERHARASSKRGKRR